MSILVDTITAPAFLASALVNGDLSSFNEADIECFNRVVANLDGYTIVDVERDNEGEPYEPRFTWYYRLYFGDAEGGEVINYIIHKYIVGD